MSNWLCSVEVSGANQDDRSRVSSVVSVLAPKSRTLEKRGKKDRVSSVVAIPASYSGMLECREE